MLFRNRIDLQFVSPELPLLRSGLFNPVRSKNFQARRIMQPTQPVLRHELILQMKRNERTAEERKLQLLKERLQATERQLQAVRAA